MRNSIESFLKQPKRQDELTAFLEHVVNIYSPTTDAAAVTKVGSIFAERYEKLGFHVERTSEGAYGSHLIAELKGRDSKGPCILLMGHLDTVETLHPESRKFNLKDNIATGLGVLDMKGGLVTLLYAVEAFLWSCGASFPGTIRIFYNADEEIGSPSSRPLLPSVLNKVVATLIAEPSKPDGAVHFRRKGCGVFHVKVRGKASHAGSAPEKGRSAIRELIEKLREMEDLKKNGTSVNVGTIQGGIQPYIVPEKASASVDVRVPDVSERKRMESSIEAIRQKNFVPDTQTVIEGGFHRPPIDLIPGSRNLVSILEGHAKTIGAPISFPEEPEGAVGDINNIVDFGVPGVDGTGPLGSGAHSEEEYIIFSSLYDRTLLTALTLNSLLNGGLKDR